LTEAASTQKMIILIFKDISWLWRSAYNCAVQGCSEWECAGEQISELFDISKEVTYGYITWIISTDFFLLSAAVGAVAGSMLLRIAG
jgi:hypothetical protein